MNEKRLGEMKMDEKMAEAGGMTCQEGKLGKDDFRGVDCEGCGTRVALQDVDEVFHFFNVLASH